MKIKYQTYIVVEIPEPICTKIKKIRSKLNTPTSKLPVEITIAGSSGVLPIPSGTGISLIKAEVNKITSKYKPFFNSFAKIEYFPNTSIVYLSLSNRKPFDDLHRVFKESKLNFQESQFPYTPHCTLRAGDKLSSKELIEICSMPFPKSQFQINTISVYYYDDSSMYCHLLYQRELDYD